MSDNRGDDVMLNWAKLFHKTETVWNAVKK